jgi:uncharacterized protein (UPF0261 family)
MEKPKILVAGILDTKGNEVKFISERIKAAGGKPVILEVSVGKEVGWADINLNKVISNAEIKMQDFLKMNKQKRVEVIIKGGIELVRNLLKEGNVDGIVGMGGSMGSSIITSIMQTMPIGIPKLMISTMASADTTEFVGTKDIAMIYPIAEAGLNVVTRKVLNNAAGAIVGMCSAPEEKDYEEKKLIGFTMLGVTTPTVQRASRFFEDKGFDTIINHATGSGGKSMEELVTDGYIVGIMDITTWEVQNHLCNVNHGSGPNRLTSAGKKGIPQVVSTGGLDVFVWLGPLDVIPEVYKKESKKKVPGRGIMSHNPMVSVVGTTVEEVYRTGKVIAEKLNNAIGPTSLCIPMRGFGSYDSSGGFPKSGWTEEKPSPIWVQDPKNEKWSNRATILVKAIKENIDFSKKNLDILIVDRHLNEPEFADLMAEMMNDMLLGKWKKGIYNNKEEVLSF